MTPNLRYNKKLTNYLIKSIPSEDRKINPQTVIWNLENDTDRIYGLCYDGWFKRVTFLLQKVDDERYRLVVTDGRPVCNFYIIDDLEEFLNFVGVELMEYEDTKGMKDALVETAIVPNTGIIMVDENKIYIYDHKNY